MPNFRRGVTAASEAADSKVQFDKTGYFSLKDGETEVVRFLMEGNEWPTVDYHTAVPVQKEAPEGRKNWPKALSAVCRYTKDENEKPFYDNCAIEDLPIVNPADAQYNAGKVVSRQTRTFAPVVMRDPIIVNGKRQGYKDRLKEVAEIGEDGKPTGNTKRVPDIRWVIQAYSNFYSALDGFYSVFDTVLNCDFHITRKRSDKDTTYNIVRLDPTPDWDLRDPKVAAEYGITVNADGSREYPDKFDPYVMLDRQSSDEYFGMYFDPRLPQIVNDSEESEVEEVKPGNDSSNAELDDLKDRIKSYQNQNKGQNPPDFGG